MSARRATLLKRLAAAGMLGALAACAPPSPRAPATASPGLLPARLPAVESVEPWSFGGASGRIIRTRHYRIYTTETNAAIVDQLPAFLEEAMSHYRAALGSLPAPRVRLDTYLMDNRSQWQRLTLQLMGEQGERFLKIGRGGFATRGVAVLFDLGVYDTLSISAHEGWHQYTQRTFRNTLPTWLEEGVATYMEGHRWGGDLPTFLPWANVERFDQLRRAASQSWLLPLDELLGASPHETLGRVDEAGVTYYAQVWALVHFLNEGANGRYRAGLRELLVDGAEGRIGATVGARLGERAARDAVTGRDTRAVFEAYFNSDLAQAAEEYATFIETVASAGSRDSIVAGLSPFDPGAERLR